MGTGGVGPPDLTSEQWARVVEHRHSALRIAKRYAAGNLSGDEVSALAEDGLAEAVRGLDPARGTLEAYARTCIRRKVHKAIRKRARELDVVVPAGALTEADLARARRRLDDVGAFLADEGDLFEDGPEDRERQALGLAEDGMFALTIGQLARSGDTDPERALLRRAELARLEAALGEIEPAHATIVRMRFLGDAEMDAISTATGLSEATIYRLIPVILRRLRLRVGRPAR